MDKNSQRYMIIRSFIFIGLIGYMAYNLFIEKSAVLRQQIQQEITASKRIIPGDKWLAVINKTESSFSYLVNEYGLIRQINNILLPDPTKQVRGINIVAEKATSYILRRRTSPCLSFSQYTAGIWLLDGHGSLSPICWLYSLTACTSGN